LVVHLTKQINVWMNRARKQARSKMLVLSSMPKALSLTPKLCREVEGLRVLRRRQV